MSQNTVTITRSQDDPGDLCGYKEAAAILEVERTRIARYQEQGKMPPLLGRLAQGPVYLRADIEAMAEARKAKSADRDPAAA